MKPQPSQARAAAVTGGPVPAGPPRTGEGGARVRLALTLAPIDATGRIGPACYWAIINGMRPAPR